MTICVVDFLRFDARRPLAELLVESDCPVHHTVDPVNDLAESREVASLAELAERYAVDLVDSATPPHVVVGVCAAAKLSLLITAKLRKHEIDARCVLVDPRWAGLDDVAVSFEEVQRSMRSGVTSEEPNAAGRRIEQMLTVLDAELHAVFAKRGHGLETEPVIKALLNRYRAWFEFLRISGEAAPALPPTRLITPPGFAQPSWWTTCWHATTISDLEQAIRYANQHVIDRIITTIAEAGPDHSQADTGFLGTESKMNRHGVGVKTAR
ncbi:hypothetical protein GA0070609_3380 [Micromonospora echinaurantiaca]|uniref:Uncharacterized protein n=1 Tax=Micromonospora echinaurantiaca TaxID=47857 RepID=A0A1C5IIQ9_9ACTN|nr:hypothetical protein [Micromonospora echinaurantiaca]SCG57911.1 hypothetical protein GA0070609_3380 [Micromonospora echinaurantiaca]